MKAVAVCVVWFWRKKLHAGDTDVYLCLDDERCVCIFCDECEREHKIFKKHSVDPKEGHFLVSGSSLRLPRRLLIELMKSLQHLAVK